MALQGTIQEIEQATGLVTIQPNDGSEKAFFMNHEITEDVKTDDVVEFDIDSARSAPSAPGLQAVNIKIVK